MMSRWPVLFIGHGSPMNAIEENAYTKTLRRIGESLGRPNAVLCISAHWETAGTRVTHIDSPRTIHDFGGFPQALFEIEYPAPGSPKLAERIQRLPGLSRVSLDESWGLDHGTWSVLRHIYPEADVPVVQLSLDRWLNAAEHLRIAEALRPLREEGVLIVGSGNIVHNLSVLDWRRPGEAYPWAVDFDAWVHEQVMGRKTDELLRVPQNSEAAARSVPSLEHYWPFLYAFGASDERDESVAFYQGLEYGSISMRSYLWGSDA